MTAPWPEVPLTAVADLVRGVSYPKTDSRDDAAAGYVPVLRATNIQDARLVLESDLVYVAESNVSPDQRLRPGDIVVATSSGSKHLVGKSALLHAHWNGSFGAFCAGIRPKPNIESRYLAYFLQSPRYWKEIGKKALGVNINNLRRGDLETLSLPLPPAELQRQIVAEIEKQFSRLDEAVANLQRVKANLKRYEKANVEQMTDSAAFEPVFEGVIGEVAVSLDNMRRPVNKTERATRPGTIPYLGANGQTGWIDAPLFDEELVLVVEDETFVGRTAPFSYYFAGKCWVNNHTHVLRAKQQLALPKYLNLALSYYPFIPLTTGSTGRRKLTKAALMAAPISLPSLRQQHDIVAEVDRQLSITRAIAAEVAANLDRASKLRNAVLTGAFSQAPLEVTT
ncbi:MAG: restriction endonuclease subunit S [Burkholderiaceae bacterium]